VWKKSLHGKELTTTGEPTFRLSVDTRSKLRGALATANPHRPANPMVGLSHNADVFYDQTAPN
jgi:hypothetical protein